MLPKKLKLAIRFAKIPLKTVATTIRLRKEKPISEKKEPLSFQEMLYSLKFGVRLFQNPT